MTDRKTIPKQLEARSLILNRTQLGAGRTEMPLVRHLSTNEKEFLKRLAQGDSYKEIAAGMNISINTVRDHVRTVYKKFAVNSRTKAVVKYLSTRWETAEPAPAAPANHACSS